MMREFEYVGGFGASRMEVAWFQNVYFWQKRNADVEKNMLFIGAYVKKV